MLPRPPRPPLFPYTTLFRSRSGANILNPAENNWYLNSTTDYNHIDDIDERIAALNKMVEQLPQKTRFVLQQCYYEKHTYKEVGDMMGMTADGVKKHIVKAFAILRERFNVK